MQHVYISRIGDLETIEEHLTSLSQKSNVEIVDAYNRQKRIYGVHQQVLYLIALDKIFRERFGKSPITNEGNRIYGLSGRIIYFPILDTFEKSNEN